MRLIKRGTLPIRGLFLLAALLCGLGSAAATTISVDPTAGPTNNGCTGTVTTCATGSFTAAQSNELLIFVAVCGGGGAGSATVTSVTDSGPGLTWSKRQETKNASAANGGPFIISLWYGKAAGAFTGAVTAHWTGCASANSSVGVFGVQNAAATPWDANGSLTAVTTGITANPTVGPISTSNANAMLLIFIGGGEGPGAPSGWTASPLGSLANFGGCCLTNGAVAYKIVSATQSSLSATYTNGATNWITFGDAIDDASQPPPSAGHLMFKSGPGW